jgi:amidophosphoribosyltransferase
MPIPDGGIYAALGYAEASGIPFDLGIMRNHYVGRTFIQPTKADRKSAVKIKLNPIRNAIEGKRVCLIEDSIVRGNTSRERVKTLRACGAKEVHIRISCPPHVSPCYYGIDFPSKEELIANNHTKDEISKLIDVDSLHYLSLEGMLSCVKGTASKDFCHACFSAEYPIAPRGLIDRS